METGRLYLIPNRIAEGTNDVIPSHTLESISTIQYFLAENIRTARRFLGSLKLFPSIQDLHFELLDKDTTPETVVQLMDPLRRGMNVGVISESGCPGVADPGALAVRFAHANKIQVVPLVGPSSILMALMASGMQGQRFAFHGYLPVDGKEAAAVIHELESESRKKKQTQIFIETPHRNNSLFEVFLKNLHPETHLTVAVNITGKDESITTQSVALWRAKKYSWPKVPAVFLFDAGNT